MRKRLAVLFRAKDQECLRLLFRLAFGPCADEYEEPEDYAIFYKPPKREKVS